MQGNTHGQARYRLAIRSPVLAFALKNAPVEGASDGYQWRDKAQLLPDCLLGSTAIVGVSSLSTDLKKFVYMLRAPAMR